MSVGSAKNVQLTVLTGINEVIRVLDVVSDSDAAERASVSGDGKTKIFVIDELPLPPQAADNPVAALVTYIRRTAPLVRQGAKVVLVRVSDDSILFDAAATLRQQPVTIPVQFEPQCDCAGLQDAGFGRRSDSGSSREHPAGNSRSQRRRCAPRHRSGGSKSSRDDFGSFGSHRPCKSRRR